MINVNQIIEVYKLERLLKVIMVKESFLEEVGILNMSRVKQGS